MQIQVLIAVAVNILFLDELDDHIFKRKLFIVFMVFVLRLVLIFLVFFCLFIVFQITGRVIRKRQVYVGRFLPGRKFGILFLTITMVCPKWQKIAFHSLAKLTK